MEFNVKGKTFNFQHNFSIKGCKSKTLTAFKNSRMPFFNHLNWKLGSFLNKLFRVVKTKLWIDSKKMSVVWFFVGFSLWWFCLVSGTFSKPRYQKLYIFPRARFDWPWGNKAHIPNMHALNSDTHTLRIQYEYNIWYKGLTTLSNLFWLQKLCFENMISPREIFTSQHGSSGEPITQTFQISVTVKEIILFSIVTSMMAKRNLNF